MSGRGVRARRGAASPALLVACALGVLSSCGAPKDFTVDFSETPRDYVARDYERVYDLWTRHDRVLQEVDIALEVWATFKSWDYREAYVERYADIYSLSEADRKALRDAQRDAFHSAYEFHLTAQATDYKWNDLEKESSPWRVTLVDALGHELAPEFVRIQKLPDFVERQFYPAKNPFTKSYVVRFPAGGADFVGLASGSVTLRIASPAGRLELRWHST